MKFMLNGKPQESAHHKLSDILSEAGFDGAVVATALNGVFIPVGARETTELSAGDALEVLAPMQGG